MEIATYRELGVHEGLVGNMLERYVRYMETRWKSEESLNCRCGYAKEWADRFKGNSEYACSDSIGKAVLDSM